MNFQNLNKNKPNKGFPPRKPEGQGDSRPPIYHPVQQPPRREEYVDVDMERVLKRVSLFFGFALLAISIYFSYDGFDSSMSGGNSSYTALAKVIGVTMAIGVSLLQFVFSSSYKQLNWTLLLFGMASYVYSMRTDYLGVIHVLRMDNLTAIAATLFMDGVPEPLIAWALGASLKGDALGNLGKAVWHVALSLLGVSREVKNHTYDVRSDLKGRIGK